jgi:hypothetical protein
MQEPDRSLVVLLLDATGQSSTLADAVRAAGHRVITATGLDTAVVVLHSLEPDLIIARSEGEAKDQRTAARFQEASPAIPVRFVQAPGDGLDDALHTSPQLN